MHTDEKNILFITNLHVWSLGKGKGGPAFIRTLEGFKMNGWKVWLISTGGTVPEGLIENGKLVETSYPLLDSLSSSKIRIISIIARFLKLYFLNIFYFKKGCHLLKQNSNKKFLIYAYEVNAVYSSNKLARKFSLPLITRFQGTKHSNTPHDLSNRIRKFPSFQAYSTAASLTIMTNDGTQGFEMLKRVRNKSKEILFWRNGVEKLPKCTLDMNQKLRHELRLEPYFTYLTVSRLVNWKRLDRSICAFAEVNNRYPDTRLIIIGDGEAKNTLSELTHKLKISDKVIFKGSIEQKMVSKYMLAADVFLSFYDLSNVGNPLMEAMMCGKPIITLDVGETSDLIKNNVNGVLLPIEELSKIPEKMIQLIEDKEFAIKIGSAALKTAHTEFWSWEERISAEITKVESLLN